jgi:hypothetical protein
MGRVSPQLQVSLAVPLTVVPLPVVAVAVTVIAPAVAPVHVATPLVESFTLLMLTLTGSETDQVAKPKGNGGRGHPEANTGPGMNCCWFPGGTALWLAVALAGEMLTAVMLQSWVLEPPQPALAQDKNRTQKIAKDVLTAEKSYSSG